MNPKGIRKPSLLAKIHMNSSSHYRLIIIIKNVKSVEFLKFSLPCPYFHLSQSEIKLTEFV
ncbi:hypothetical protein VCHA48O428_260050 [Vibrio chagasii]|nr:hypothetical protein VCHA36P164_80035 [Vibrio chagasii]CAH7179728.1 hypothetical protein VCHA48O428_260050 [Vibrio chagasii]CAH7320177.1 hypothetical protein VCHA40P242_60050 [Vibrio chagasii]